MTHPFKPPKQTCIFVLGGCAETLAADAEAIASATNFIVESESDPQLFLYRLLEGRLECGLIVLDPDLPGIPGRKVLRMIRQDRDLSSTPVIILSSSRDPGESADFLDDGADDFVRRPYRIDDLAARIHAVLRRVCRPWFLMEKVSLGAVVFDLASSKVRLNGKTLGLTGAEFDLLRLLAQAGGSAVQRGTILRKLWDIEAEEGRKAPSRTIQTHIDNLRRKLGEHRGLVETVSRNNLRFNLELSEELTASSKQEQAALSPR